MPKLKVWTEQWCKGNVLNLFAGMIKLNVEEVRVDIDPEMPAGYHLDAYDFICSWEGDKFDTVIFDPPYNLRKSREKYNGRYFGSLRKIKIKLPTILNPNARIISFGYDSVGFGTRRGFYKKAICLVCHSGDHNDTICLVEEMEQMRLEI